MIYTKYIGNLLAECRRSGGSVAASCAPNPICIVRDGCIHSWISGSCTAITPTGNAHLIQVISISEEQGTTTVALTRVTSTLGISGTDHAIADSWVVPTFAFLLGNKWDLHRLELVGILTILPGSSKSSGFQHGSRSWDQLSHDVVIGKLHYIVENTLVGNASTHGDDSNVILVGARTVRGMNSNMMDTREVQGLTAVVASVGLVGANIDHVWLSLAMISDTMCGSQNVAVGDQGSSTTSKPVSSCEDRKRQRTAL